MSADVDTDELVRYLFTSLVEHPEDVTITRSDLGDTTAYEVSVHADDVGKVIGRGGRVIKAVRVLVRAAAAVDGADATVDVAG